MRHCCGRVVHYTKWRTAALNSCTNHVTHHADAGRSNVFLSFHSSHLVSEVFLSILHVCLPSCLPSSLLPSFSSRSVSNSFKKEEHREGCTDYLTRAPTCTHTPAHVCVRTDVHTQTHKHTKRAHAHARAHTRINQPLSCPQTPIHEISRALWSIEPIRAARWVAGAGAGQPLAQRPRHRAAGAVPPPRRPHDVGRVRRPAQAGPRHMRTAWGPRQANQYRVCSPTGELD